METGRERWPLWEQQLLPAGAAEVVLLCGLQVDSPSCLWSRVSSGPAAEAETVERYRQLTQQMNLFYQDVTKEQLKPSVLEQGQVLSSHPSL